jgi:hypothetical protein
MMLLLITYGGVLSLMFARGLAHEWGQLFALMVVLIKRLDCKRKHNNNNKYNELINNTSAINTIEEIQHNEEEHHILHPLR